MLSSLASHFPQNCFLSLMYAIGREIILMISIMTSSFRQTFWKKRQHITGHCAKLKPE